MSLGTPGDRRIRRRLGEGVSERLLAASGSRQTDGELLVRGFSRLRRLYSDGAVPIERSRSRSHLPHVALTERQGSDTSRPSLLERAKLLV